MLTFKNINSLVGKSKILDSFAIFCAVPLIYLMVAVLFLLSLLEKNWQMFIYPMLSGFFAGFVIDEIIYFFYKRKRPADLEGTKLLIRKPKNPSFPSRHTSIIFGISFLLFIYNFNLAVVFVALGCLIGASRVFCGIHWLSDIIAGIVVGLISSLIISYLIIFL